MHNSSSRWMCDREVQRHPNEEFDSSSHRSAPVVTPLQSLSSTWHIFTLDAFPGCRLIGMICMSRIVSARVVTQLSLDDLSAKVLRVVAVLSAVEELGREQTHRSHNVEKKWITSADLSNAWDGCDIRRTESLIKQVLSTSWVCCGSICFGSLIVMSFWCAIAFLKVHAH